MINKDGRREQPSLPATFAENPEGLANRLIVARHEAAAHGGFGVTSERAAGAGDPTCLEEEEGAPAEDRGDRGTTPSAAKRARSEKERQPATISVLTEPAESERMAEKCRPEENPMAGAWHRYPQPWDPTLEQNKHHSGD